MPSRNRPSRNGEAGPADPGTIQELENGDSFKSVPIFNRGRISSAAGLVYVLLNLRNNFIHL